MASFFKEFLLEDARRLSSDTGREVRLAAFGKHPAWKDHNGIQIGLQTASLLLAWDRLYENGIGGKGGPITSEEYSWKKWEEKSPGELLPGFDHSFIWWRSGQFLAGRLWATSDHARPPRRDYPLITCFQAVGIPLIWGIRGLLPCLETVPDFCQIRNPAEIEATVQQVWSSEAFGETLRDQVQTGFARLQRELRQAIAQVPPEGFAPPLTPQERQQFIAAPEFGPDQEGLLRVFYQVDNQFSAYLGQKSLVVNEAFGPAPCQIRVPLAAPDATEGMLRWIEFFQLLLSPGTPILLTSAKGTDWIDVTVGEPAAANFFGLRASTQALPVASSTPFTIDSSVREKGARIIKAYLAGERLIAQPKPSGSLFQTATAFFRRQSKPPEAPPKPPPQKKPWLFLAVLGLTGLIGISAYNLMGPGKAPTRNELTVTLADQSRPYEEANPSLIVTASNLSRPYGVANPPLSGSITSNRDNITASFRTQAEETSAVGAYDIVPILSDPNHKLGNYQVITNVGTLTITRAELRIMASNQSRPFGAMNPPLTGWITPNPDGITAIFESEATERSPVGTYDIVAWIKAANDKLANYELMTNVGTLTVTRAQLSVTTSNAGIPVPGINPVRRP